MPLVSEAAHKIWARIQEADDVSQANDRQVGGDHYRQRPGEQHWDRVNRLGLDYFQAQITKYVERCWLKNGIQDLKKARHFLDKYIELKEAEAKAQETKTMVKLQEIADKINHEEEKNEDKEEQVGGPHPSHKWLADTPGTSCGVCGAGRSLLSGTLPCGQDIKEIAEAEKRLAKIIREM